MSEQTLNARINTLEAIKFAGNDVSKMFIDSELIAMAHNARKHYQNHLEVERQKKIEEEESKQKQRDTIEREQAEQSKRRREDDELIQKINEAKKRIDEKKATIAEVTSAAETMLASGLRTKNFDTMQTAQTMFDNAKKQREELHEIEKEIENLNKTKKQKSSLITGYFQNPKK